MRVSGLVGVATTLAAASMGRADVVHLSALRDTTLYESPGGVLGNGAGEFFFAGKTKDGEIRRGLVAFDLAAGLPAGAAITSVTLTLRMSKGISNDHALSLHRVLADWGEGDSDAPQEEGHGAPAAPGDATWLHTFYDDSLWISRGGDFAQAPSAALPVGGMGEYTWGSTPELVADAQAWLDSPESNFGWCLIGKENETFTTKRFNSRENADGATQPLLTVEFIPPPCRADCDQSTGVGVLDLFDLLCFQNAFIASDPTADCTTDGEFDMSDFLCFMGLFDAGC